MRLWIAQALTQTAQNAIWYALLVIVEEATHSTTQLGITILSVIIPSVLFGVPAGAFVDRWDKRNVLVITNALRAVVVLGYIVFNSTIGLLLAVSFVFSVISQFFAPAETAMIPAIVSRPRLIQANSFFHLTFTASQLVGLVFVGPLIVKLTGATTFFVAMSVLYAVSAVLVWRMPPQPDHEVKRLQVNPVSELFVQLREVVSLLLADRSMLLAMSYLTLGGTLTLIVAMLAPRYAVEVLGIAAADAVFIMAPAGVGMVATALLLSRANLQWLADRQRLVTSGLFLVGGALFVVSGLPILGRIAGLLGPEGQELSSVEAEHIVLVGGVMLATLVAGCGFAAIMVASQTLLQERAPVHARGRVFAVQLMLGNLFSIIPLLSIGELADNLGVNRVLVILAAGVLLVAVLSSLPRRARGPVVDVPTS
jgi:MFS family permease